MVRAGMWGASNWPTATSSSPQSNEMLAEVYRLQINNTQIVEYFNRNRRMEPNGAEASRYEFYGSACSGATYMNEPVKCCGWEGCDTNGSGDQNLQELTLQQNLYWICTECAKKRSETKCDEQSTANMVPAEKPNASLQMFETYMVFYLKAER